MSISEWVVIAVLLLIICFWPTPCQDEEDTLPVHRPQQHLPVYQPPHHPAPPSQSYRPTPYTPLLYQQHQRVRQLPPSPRPPPPSQRHQSSPYTPPVRQPEQHQPVNQPPPSPRPLLPSQRHRSSPYTPPIRQPEQHRPVNQPPPSPRPLLPSQRHRSSSYTPPVPQPEQHQPVTQPPPSPCPPLPSQSNQPLSPPEPPKHEDEDQTDRSDEYYSGLRARANKEGDEMAKCFSGSHEAFDRGDHAAAKDLSNQGKDHKQKMEQLNKEASTWIYREKNRGRPPGEIDLHGLYVKEAITYTDTALAEAWLRKDSEIRLIVGKGLHAKNGEAKLGPAIIEELMRKYQLVAELDPSNSGVLIVKLN